jgi:4-carboxymuconolactone decarboxylase
MSLGQANGPLASAKQLQYLEALIAKAGYASFREARHPLGLTQRQASGKFSTFEASALIETLLASPTAASEGASVDHDGTTDEESSGPRTASEKRRPKYARIPAVTSPSDDLVALYAKGLARPDGKPLNIFGTLGHHPALLKRFNVLGGLFLSKGTLPEREREIVILRVGWNCRAVYEFGQHTIIGKRVGLTDAEIAALVRNPSSYAWRTPDAALIAMADELCTDDCVSDRTWQDLSGRWDEAQLIELVMVAGFYRMVSGFLNSTGVPLDPDTPGWPD